MKFTVQLLEKILVIMAIATFAGASEMSSEEGFDANELPIKSAAFADASEMSSEQGLDANELPWVTKNADLADASEMSSEEGFDANELPWVTKNADLADGSEMSSEEGFDANELPSRNADFANASEMSSEEGLDTNELPWVTKNAEFADASEKSSEEGLDANELSSNTADLLTDSHDKKVFQELESLAERGYRCSPTNSCTSAGGRCVKSRAKCNGRLDASGCTGGKKCKCCIPNVTCPATTTCPNTTTTTCPTVTCPAVTACPIITSTTCPTVTCPAVSPSTEVWCSYGDIRVGNQCFRRYSTTKTWTAAQAYCTSQGLQLAQPADPNLLRHHMTQRGWMSLRHWLGGQGAGTYMKWLNGTCLPNTSPVWRNGNTPDSTSTSYGLDMHNSNVPGPLDADSKTNTYPFVCEREAGLPFRIRNQWFGRYSTTKTWTAAHAYCTSQGLQLAQPADPNLLRQYMINQGWDNIKHWLGGSGSGSCMSWQNGTCIPSSSPLWAWTQSSSHISTSSGLDIYISTSYSGELDMDSKSSLKPFFCEMI